MVEKSECIFPFLNNLIFKPYHLSSHLTPLQGGGIDIGPRWLFCPKFDAEKLLFEAFFLELCVFYTTVQYYHRNKWNTDSLFTAKAIKNGACLHLCCSSALTPPDFLEHVFTLLLWWLSVLLLLHFFICFYFTHFSRLNSISIILFWENTGSAGETSKYSKFRIILFVSVCNLTLPLTLPYLTSYLTLPYITIHLALPYHTLP